MNIILNGEPAELHGKTVADLIAQTSPKKPFAVAVNTGSVSYTHLTLPTTPYV